MEIKITANPTATDLVDAVARLNAEYPLTNPLLERGRAGTLTVAHLRALVAGEIRLHPPEMGTYGVLIGRFPFVPAAPYFGKLASMVYGATPRLMHCAAELGLDDDEIDARTVGLPNYAYNGVMSWLGQYGSTSAAALAALVDIEIYYRDTFELLDLIRARGLDAPKPFMDYYANGEPGQWEDGALEVIQHGLDSGDNPRDTVHAGRLMAECIEQFWIGVDANAR
ncbi:hypothetical protein D5S18_26370 [Nocardia panacis]|uniref:Thiaminase-2/PQQC domain-containing protein n=1 Tax=Nocardia panacis TaxID=2340916 RepID=A0A3A4KAW0_9NOCA|nr:hypothetical protein [Nocardia panacis]RJO70731.1 hypothetical protein D5S18_26370 [Nocardia panacis]